MGRRTRTLIVVLSMLGGSLIGDAASAEPPPLGPTVIRKLEAMLVLPRGAERLERYTRYYAVARADTADDLPFSTILDGVHVRKGQPLVLGIFALPNKWTLSSAGAQIVRLSAFPQFVHGGCWAVNVVYDPVHERLLGVWCNVADDGNPPRPPA
jgi:hypothetical protein